MSGCGVVRRLALVVAWRTRCDQLQAKRALAKLGAVSDNLLNDDAAKARSTCFPCIPWSPANTCSPCVRRVRTRAVTVVDAWACGGQPGQMLCGQNAYAVAWGVVCRSHNLICTAPCSATTTNDVHSVRHYTVCVYTHTHTHTHTHSTCYTLLQCVHTHTDGRHAHQ